MKLEGKKVGVLIESDFYEQGIYYYQHRFPEEGIELHFLSRLWGQPYLTFKGHEYHVPFECHESFENMTDEELRTYDAIIVPSAIVSDRLRYTEDINKLSPAVEFIKRVFAEPDIIKGIICHGMWLISPVPELVRGRNVVGHINLLGDIRNMGANYIDQDVVVDGDLVTGRTGGHCHLFARKIIDLLYEKDAQKKAATTMQFNHVALNCKDPILVEKWYTKHFGFTRSSVFDLGEGNQLVFIKGDGVMLELFQTKYEAPTGKPINDGPAYQGVRHIAFKVDSVDAVLTSMGSEAVIKLGPMDFDAFIPGWRTVWVADPEGNIVEISQGYKDQENPPPLP